jgi:hypothetical protein
MGNSRQEKRARILARQKRRQTITIAITATVATAAVVVGIALFVNGSRQKSNPATSSIINAPIFGDARTVPSRGDVSNVTPVNGVVSFNTSDFADGTAAFFTTQAAGKSINFFVLQSSDGVIRAAFDACDVCFPAKKGYRQDGDLMVCNNCGQQFRSIRINVEKGGCNPSPLDRTVEDGKLLIALTDIEKGAMYF